MNHTKEFEIKSKKVLLPDLNYIFICRHGSHLYGMENENSDLDIKGVYLPSEEEMLIGNSKSEYTWSSGSAVGKNGSEDIDMQFFSLPRFVEMLISGDTIAIDMIHCNKDNAVLLTSAWLDLSIRRSMFYSKNMKAFTGYIKKQVHRYGVRGSRIEAMESVVSLLKPYGDERLVDVGIFSEWFESGLRGQYKDSFSYAEKGGIDYYVVCGSKYSGMTRCNEIVNSLMKKLEGYGDRAKKAKENNGVDWKAVSHAFRCAYQLEEIYSTGDLVYPLKDASYLKDIKSGNFEFFGVVDVALDELVDRVTDLALNSDMDDQVDSKKAWDLCINIMT